MSEALLKNIEVKLDELIRTCESLERENADLKRTQLQWHEEKARLTEKNNLARQRIESMIAHLKSLETES